MGVPAPIEGVDRVRNVALMGHSRAGKTTLAEAMLFASGALSRMGRVEDGNTVSDHDEEEHRHGYSISLALVTLDWDGHRLNLLDTPGYADFEGEVASAAFAADTAVILVDAVAGVEGGTEAAWRQAEIAAVPARFFVISRIDRENADFDRVLEQLRSRYGRTVAPIAIPGGESGVVSLLADVAAPAALEATFTAGREMLIEAIGETDDDLLARYLDGTPITGEELRAALARAVRQGNVTPVMLACALTSTGVAELLGELVALGARPTDRTYMGTNGDAVTVDEEGPFVARTFKTSSDPFVGHLSFVKVLSGRWSRGDHALNHRAHADERAAHLLVLRGREQFEVPELRAGEIGVIPKLGHTATGDVMTVPGGSAPELAPLPFPIPTYRSALHPRSRDDVDRMAQGLARMVEQDPTLRTESQPETGEVILLTLGDVHATIAAARLEREYGVGVDVTEPRVPYVETIRLPAQAEYRHKKQSGGRGQFGHVILRIEPLGRGAGFEFTEEVVGGDVPRQFIPAVEHGIVEALPEGPLAKSRLVDLKATLLGGSSHSVDSSEIAFKIAGAQALHQAVLAAEPVLLEPVMHLLVHAPGELVGDVTSEITGRRGNVLGMEPNGAGIVIDAVAPLAEVQRFGTQLRSLTHGRGTYTIEFDHYGEVPDHLQARLLEERASHP